MVYGECDPGWEHRWNKCYYFSTESRNWEGAEVIFMNMNILNKNIKGFRRVAHSHTG